MVYATLARLVRTFKQRTKVTLTYHHKKRVPYLLPKIEANRTAMLEHCCSVCSVRQVKESLLVTLFIILASQYSVRLSSKILKRLVLTRQGTKRRASISSILFLNKYTVSINQVRCREQDGCEWTARSSRLRPSRINHKFATSKNARKTALHCL